MNQINRTERAIELHKNGYNCAQAVLGAFADICKLDLSTALKLSQPLGAGISELREICGAVNAMAQVVGLLEGSPLSHDKDSRKHCYNAVRQLAEQFKDENGAIVCRHLLSGGQNADTKFKKKPCVEYVAQCAKLLEKYINAKNSDIAKLTD